MICECRQIMLRKKKPSKVANGRRPHFTAHIKKFSCFKAEKVVSVMKLERIQSFKRRQTVVELGKHLTERKGKE